MPPAKIGIQKAAHTVGDDGADFLNLGKIFDRGLLKILHGMKMLGQDRGHAGPHVPDRKRVEQPRESSGFAGFDRRQ